MNTSLIYPSIYEGLAIGFVISLAIGLIVILLRDRIDNVFHSYNDVDKEFNLPILAQIPYSYKE